ncbi:MAG: tRNA pseudouridine(13) synthase TruD [Methanomassiliicoccales archaeon]|jgi:tRNA pseudouridine13 synthase|nr:tRNA pseudouridine(13) synthase TruD [Methanomassiliicoccales archaeon]MDD1755302.1 tRNA pseudouridine(13) synthase TruD [Methanomassiliicoccales archaeon]
MGFLECRTTEALLGLEVFYTDTHGTKGRLKREVEDFVVDEISRHPPEDPAGRYTIAKVTSINWETNRLVRQMSRQLGISRNRISFAGTKDKRAVTSQLMCFEAPLEEVQGLRMHQVTIEAAYRSRKNLTIGDLIGNSFKIKVRDCALAGDELRSEATATLSQLESLGGFPNFFGVQRFGSLRPITHIVGKHIIKGQFEEACMAYAANPVPEESEEARIARQFVHDTRDYPAALRLLPRHLMFERTLIEHLSKDPNDYPGAIRALPRNLQMMFVHAYQAFLFNLIMSERVRRGIPLDAPVVGDIVLPMDKLGLPDHDKPVPVTIHNLDLVSSQVRNRRASVSAVLFGSESVLCEGEPGEIERMMIEREGVSKEDFVVPLIPECSSTGSRRELVAEFHDLRFQADEDALDISFSLGKGCYATCLLREVMKADMIEADRATYSESAEPANR